MASEVDPHACDKVTRGCAADPGGALDERHAVAVARRPVGRAHARGPRPQHQHVDPLGQLPAVTAAPVAAP